MSKKTPVSLGSTPSGRPQLKSVTAANATPGSTQSKSVPQAHAASGSSTQFKFVQPKKKGKGVLLGQKNKPQT